jgi:hypothetical protein
MPREYFGNPTMPISTEMVVRIAHADIALDMAFPRSVARWQRGVDIERPCKVLGGDCGAVLIGEHDHFVIEGNCSNSVSAPDGGVMHINGDLASTIDASGFHEIVIAGDVLPNAKIHSSGYCHVFVGGRFRGEFCSTDSTKLWIESDFDGAIRTGNPSTQIYIGGDCTGNISPGETAALLALTVGGFASYALLSTIAKCGYTVFNASIARSDIPSGIYPEIGRTKKPDGGNSFNRWCVHSQVGT